MSKKETFLSRDSAVITKLYKSLVRRNLEYAVQAWCPLPKQDIDTLKKYSVEVLTWFWKGKNYRAKRDKKE